MRIATWPKLGAAVLFVAFVGFVHTNDAHANVYAAQLKITNPDGSEFDGSFSDGSGAVFSFFLNDDASAVTIVVKEFAGDEVARIEAGALNRGQNEVAWDGSGTEENKNYIFEITAEQPNYSDTEWTIFHDSGGIGIFSRGVATVRNQNSPRFGTFLAPNTGGPLGKGITIYNSDCSFHDPFLVAPDLSSGGTIDWGGGSQTIYSGVLDDEDRFYVSSIQFGEVVRLNTDFSVTPVVTGLTNPKGLLLTGTGDDRVLYICDEQRLLRAAIGNDDVFQGTLEVIGEFQDFPRNIAMDDDGFIYLSFRTSNDLASDPVGLFKFDISGSLPVNQDDAVWLMDAALTYRIAELAFDHGASRETAADDILYFSTRAGAGSDADGIWRVTDISSFFPEATQLISDVDLYGSDGSNINDRAAIDFDAAGNIILMENSNEHIFFISPPGEGPTNNYTTVAPEPFAVGEPVSVDLTSGVPDGYALQPAYPNPFNPTTTVPFALGRAGHATLTIYDNLGRRVRVLSEGHLAAGSHRLVWDGRDDNGQAMSSGVYIVTLVSGDFRSSQRITLLK